MIVDISALAWMIRRMDVSATLKTFTATFALLTVLFYLREIYEFVVDVIRYDFDLDESGSLAWLVGSVSLMAISAFTPFAFILWDWVARQPWRYLAALNGALIGSAAAAAVSAGIGSSMFFFLEEFGELSILGRGILAVTNGTLLASLATWMASDSKRLRAVMRWIMIAVGAALLVAFLVPVVEEMFEESPGAVRDELLGLVGIGVSVVLGVWLLIRTVRHRIILSGNRPRELFLGAVYRKGFWVRLAFLTGLPSSLWNLTAMKTLAFWAFLVARPVVYGGLLLLMGAAALYDPARQAALGAGLIIGGHLLFYVAKRLAARYAWNPGKLGDKRDPILFLRSFENDQLRFRRPLWNIVGRWFDLWSFRRNADEAMIDEIAQYGPVVALGMPGEKNVPFGARRYYSSHDNWQEIVTRTAKAAQAIVIAAGSSPGVQWEYDLIARENLRGKTLLLFPPPTDDDPERNSTALKAFADTVDVHHDYGVSEGQEMVAWLPSENRAPMLLTSRKATASAYVGAVRGYFQKCSVEELADPLVL